MRLSGSRRRSSLRSFQSLLLLITFLTLLTFTVLISLRGPLHVPNALPTTFFPPKTLENNPELSGRLSRFPSQPIDNDGHGGGFRSPTTQTTSSATCATVEEMGTVFDGDGVWKESLRVRMLIHRHFQVNGASRVRNLLPDKFCRHNFVIGKASEAGFGNEMYKILTAAALSIMLNRSLIIGQTRHIGSL